MATGKTRATNGSLDFNRSNNFGDGQLIAGFFAYCRLIHPNVVSASTESRQNGVIQCATIGRTTDQLASAGKELQIHIAKRGTEYQGDIIVSLQGELVDIDWIAIRNKVQTREG